MKQRQGQTERGQRRLDETRTGRQAIQQREHRPGVGGGMEAAMTYPAERSNGMDGTRRSRIVLRDG